MSSFQFFVQFAAVSYLFSGKRKIEIRKQPHTSVVTLIPYITRILFDTFLYSLQECEGPFTIAIYSCFLLLNSKKVPFPLPCAINCFTM